MSKEIGIHTESVFSRCICSVWLALFIQPNNLTVGGLDIILVPLSPSSLPQLNETGKKLLFRDKKLRVSY